MTPAGEPTVLGHWASLGRAMAQEAGVVSSSPISPLVTADLPLWTR